MPSGVFMGKALRLLGDSINTARVDKHIEEIELSRKKRLKKQLIKIALVSTPVLVGATLSIIFASPHFVIWGNCVTQILINSSVIKSRRNSESEQSEYSSGINYISEEEFHSDIYKELEQGKSDITIESSPKLSVLSETVGNRILSKEETMALISKEIEAYSFMYNLPPLKIEEKEWNALFDITYNAFEENDNLYKYYDSMSALERYTLAKALLSNPPEIRITDFLNNMSHIECDFYPKQFLMVQKEIIERIKPKKGMALVRKNKRS